jgi:transcriptional regulator with XRE-family HTH domain
MCSPSIGTMVLPRLIDSRERDAVVEAKLEGSDEERREVFRRNLVELMRRRKISLKELIQRTNISRHVVNRWVRVGAGKPQWDHLTRLAEVLFLSDPRDLLDPNLFTKNAEVIPPKNRSVDRHTNPLVEIVSQSRPDLFRPFTDDDWNEIYSLHGTGGPLTEEGTIQAAEHINAKRALRQKFEALLETEHFAPLSAIIEVMYRDCQIPR